MYSYTLGSVHLVKDLILSAKISWVSVLQVALNYISDLPQDKNQIRPIYGTGMWKEKNGIW